jgi:hypothetical protein
LEIRAPHPGDPVSGFIFLVIACLDRLSALLFSQDSTRYTSSFDLDFTLKFEPLYAGQSPYRHSAGAGGIDGGRKRAIRASQVEPETRNPKPWAALMGAERELFVGI